MGEQQLCKLKVEGSTPSVSTTLNFPIYCSKCAEELKSTGALIFAPPFLTEHAEFAMVKHHLCRNCWPDIYAVIRGQIAKS
jgi:hypothetical protein